MVWAKEENMEFGDQMRQLRKREGLTQEQLAQRLMVTRQAVSNWERGTNLPDIETLIRIATTFHVSLDLLILGKGESNMNNTNIAETGKTTGEGETLESRMAQKLIRDGSEGRQAHGNMVTVIVGCALMLMGALCVFVKANSVEYVDAAGVLHENFFLLPIAAAFFLAGLVTVVAAGVARIVRNSRRN
jgi:transcriptional regulator with XRE-family HTH domain